MNLLGIFNFNATYLPWILLVFPIALTGTIPYGDIIGIVAGVLYEKFSGLACAFSTRIVRFLKSVASSSQRPVAIGDNMHLD